MPDHTGEKLAETHADGDDRPDDDHSRALFAHLARMARISAEAAAGTVARGSGAAVPAPADAGRRG